MKNPKADRIMRSLMLDMRLKAFDKFVLMLLPYQPQNEDGSFQVSARQLAVYARSSERTTARSLHTLAGVGYIELAEESTSSKGGFKIFFRNVSLLAIMLAFMGTSPALHKLSHVDNSRPGVKENIYYMTRRKRQRKTVASKRTKAELEKEETRRIVKQGQRALWNPPISIAAHSGS